MDQDEKFRLRSKFLIEKQGLKIFKSSFHSLHLNRSCVHVVRSFRNFNFAVVRSTRSFKTYTIRIIYTVNSSRVDASLHL